MKRCARWLVVSVLVLGALVMGGYALRGMVVAPLVERLLVREVEAHLGLRITVAGIDGSYLTGVEVTGIETVAGSAAGRLVELRAQRIAAHYSLPAVLRGTDAFLARLAIEIDGARLAVDLDRDGLANGRRREAPPALPTVLPALRVHDTVVAVRGHGGWLEAEGIEIADRDGGEGRLVLRASRLAWAYPGLREGTTQLAAEIAYSREAVVVEQLSLGGAQVVERARLALAGPPTLGARLRAWGGAVGLTGSIDRGAIRAEVQVDRVSLAPLSALVAAPPFGGNLTVHARVQLDPDRPLDLTGDLTATVADLTVRETHVDLLDLQAAVGDGTLQLEGVDIRAHDNAAYLAGSVPLSAVVAGQAASIVGAATGTFSITLSDVPAALRMAGVTPSPSGQPILPHRVVAHGEVRRGTLRHVEAVLETAGVTVTLAEGEATWPAAGVPLADTPVQARLRVDAADLAPLGTLFSLPALGGSLHGDGEVTGRLAMPQGSLHLSGADLAVGGVPLGTVALDTTAAGRRLVVERADVQRGDDRVIGAGEIDLAERRIDHAAFDVVLRDLGPYLDPWLPQGWPVCGEVTGNVTLAGPISTPETTVALDGRDLSLRGRPLGEATLRGRSVGTRLVVDAAELRRGLDHVAASGTADLAARRLEGISIDAAVADLGPDLAGLFSHRRAIGGGVTLALRASGPFTAPQGELAATLRDGRVGDLAIPQARLRADAAGGEIVVESLAVQTAQGDVGAAGTITPRPSDAALEVALDHLTLARHGTTLALTAPAHATLHRGGPYAVDHLVLHGDVGTIDLAGILAPAGESDLTFAVHDLASDGWLDALVGQRMTFSGLDATLRVGGTRAAPRLAAAGSVQRLAGTGTAVSFTGNFDLSYSGRRLKVKRFDWSAGEGQQLAVTADLPLDSTLPGWLAPGEVALDATLDLPDLRWLGDVLPPDLRGDSAISATASLAGTWDHPVGQVTVAAKGLNAPYALQPAPPGPYAVTAAAAVDGHDLDLEALRVDSPGAHVAAGGTWRDFPSPRRLLAEGADQAVTGAIHLDGTFTLSDFAWAAARAPGVHHLGGVVQGAVTIDGPARAPQATSDITVADGEVRLEANVPAVRAIRATARVTPREVRIAQASGEVGGAPFVLTGTVSRPAGKRAVVDLALTGQNLLLFRSEGVKVRTDADLQVQGPLDRLAVSGTLAITDGRLVKNIDLLTAVPGWGRPKASHGLQLFTLPDPPLRDASLHVRVTTKKPFEIRSNVARGTVRPELLLQGTGEIPVVEGEVYVDPTRITLPAGILRVESGVVRFPTDDPDRPHLDLVGRARMLGYDISAVVEGPYDEPVITLSSVPPLLEEELLLLLLTGHPPKSEATQASTHAAGMNVAVYLGKGLLARLFAGESVESDESVLDRFEVEVGRGVTRAGQETIDAQFRLAEGVLRDGDVLYITTEKDVYDDVNAGLKIVFRFE